MSNHFAHVSTPTLFHFFGWLFFLALVAELGVSVVVLALGDPSKSPLDRWATWTARHMKSDDGVPLVRPGTEPTGGQKFQAGVFFVVTMGVMAFFAYFFLGVR